MVSHARARGILFGILVFVTSTTGVLFCGGGLLPVFIFSPSAFRKLYDYCIGSWMFYIAALLQMFLGIQPVISGDKVRPNEANLLLMNHRTRLDWMFLWQVLARQGSIHSEKIILKAPLKQIPGAGWAMQVGAFMFLERRWEDDRPRLTAMMDYFAHMRHKTQVLLFPEGTNLTAPTQQRSDAFADKHSLPRYKYVLHPRVTGFTFLAQHMRNNAHIEAVYDISVGYPDNFPVTEPQLLLGNFPQEVHFHITRYDIRDLPDDEEGLSTWCQERWQEKEETLKNFYEVKKFVAAPHPNSSPSSGFGLTIVGWTVLVAVVAVALYSYWFVRWFAVLQVIFYIVMGRRGGFEMAQAHYYLQRFVQKPE